MSLFSTDSRPNVPFVMVIFGVTGDLTRRYLVPALFELYQGGYLPEKFSILGYARRDWTVDELVTQAGGRLQEQVGVDREKLKQFFAHFDYLQGNFDEPADYDRMAARLEQVDGVAGQCDRRLYYLATPAENYSAILAGIKRVGLQIPCGPDQGWTRIIVEKPFGRDLASAELLDKELTGTFSEDQIYRIDHYLAKETAQNILTFRFANALFEPVWSAEHIERIEIALHEQIGIGTRGNFYDRTGALRDMVQNHLLQLLALVTMEQPAAVTAEAFRDSRAQLLAAISAFDLHNLEEHLVLGQYAGYTKEPNVAPESRTETFVAVQIAIDGSRWKGVPMYLMTGKSLGETSTQVRVVFKKPLKSLFVTPEGAEANVLTFDIQPRQGIGLHLLAKQPGYGNVLVPVTMNFNYPETFSQHSIDAYPRLLLDAISGDQTLFTRSDEVNAEWRFIDPILKCIEKQGIKPEIYADGSAGPQGAVKLLKSN